MSSPTLVLADLSLSGQGIKGLCWDADVAAVAGIHHRQPANGPLALPQRGQSSLLSVLHIFLDWGEVSGAFITKTR